MVQRFPCLVAACVVAAALGSFLRPPSALATDPDAPDPQFARKVVYLELKDKDRSTYLQNARVRKLGDKNFMVGEYLKTPQFPDFPDVTYWIPLEDVKTIQVYKSIEDATKASQYGEKKEGK